MAHLTELDFIANMYYQQDEESKHEMPVHWLCLDLPIRNKYRKKALSNLMDYIKVKQKRGKLILAI